MADDAEISHDTLQRIADILGIPLESFLDARPPEPLNGMAQCLMLWQSIKCPTRRRKALAYLHELAEDEATQGNDVHYDEVTGSEPVAIGVASRKD